MFAVGTMPVVGRGRRVVVGAEEVQRASGYSSQSLP